MTALAERTGAVNLGQGFPDFDGPPDLLRHAKDMIDAGHNQYPPLTGVPRLRTAVAEQRARRHGTVYDPDREVLVTAGATEALAATLLALCEPGDEVVVFEPYYDAYRAGIELARARCRTVRLRPDATGRFRMDPDELAAAVTPRTRLLLLNSPHNPTGTVFDRAELAHVAAVCLRDDVIAVADEVYEYLTYDGVPHVSLAELPGMRDRTLVISSAGKTFNVTGWKVGWLCGPAGLVEQVRAVKQYLTFASGTPLQHAVAHALPTAEHWARGLAATLAQNRDRLAAALAEAGLPPYRCAGTYFLQADTRQLGEADGVRFCEQLPHRVGVVAIPSAVFYDDPAGASHVVRFAFCKQPPVLAEAARRLAGLRPRDPSGTERR
ncbi:aminotransferase class I/II-fold pyridoxal phosphate-dependent enzyme [Dactylosporangium aurantiacum]|uniref:Aminotransferase class I/II-fold pyridoxal phosphate-dependent enzyme n=2 Tax=Dactylosporangium aurantiacum TaxID=35754 RepID=A0A9Q9MK72_9ACTN|nr:aminotransferase class I/II-fold pyridoxal phosphate-dependent enzyme [Dactylosporangium aurantiacum]UWZ59859.1 aminotransferase class I/II-fold pyridoxal phosphate-dependent enzyme [Dactylosporangium aurantiacum]